MTERTFYLPKRNESKFVMNRIVEKVPCGVTEIKSIDNNGEKMIKFSVSSTPENIKKIVTILHMYGFL